MKDVMEGLNTEIKVLDHGFVRLVDCMPRLVPEDKTADYAICQAARVSYGDGTKTTRQDRGLIRYLMRNMHSSPTEMCEFKLHMKAPLFIARQTVRHRTFSLNEVSGRYSVMKPEFYRPEELRRQDENNKQGSVFYEEDDETLAEQLNEYLKSGERQYDSYDMLVAEGVAREVARIGLPLSLYTEWYWKANLHNLLHFLKLRMDSHAQWEIQQYANAILELIKPIVPFTIEAFEDYRVDSITFSKAELKELFVEKGNLSKTEQKELDNKILKLDEITLGEEF